MAQTKETGGPRDGMLTWKDILPWQRDNEFILTRYRIATFSYSRSIRTIFKIHNETANIWSHMLGALWFLLMFLQFLRIEKLVHLIRWQDAIALVLYYICVIVCFILSTIFHTFSDHSLGMHKFGNELDHLGIVLVMWGTGISGTHFAFYCRESLRNTYFVLLTGTALACAIFTLRPKFRQPAYRTTRFLMYVFLGTSLFAPVVHGLWSFGEHLEQMMGLASFLGLALINFSGAALYAARIPERWFPGTFDLIGQSHNWMHVLVFTGAVVRLFGLLDVAERWQGETARQSLCVGR